TQESQGTHTNSNVWNHYTKLNWDEKTNRKCVCNYCGSQLKCIHGTSSLIIHLERSKIYPYSKFNTTQRTPRFQGVINSSPVFPPRVFYQATSRMKLARMIIIDELAFRHVEHEGFRDFVYSLRSEFQIPSRFTIAKDCFKLWLIEREKLKSYFKQSKVRVCLTTDIWASRHHFDYICLPAHFIDDNWNLQKRILNFSCIPSHTGVIIGTTIETNLIEWGIERVLTVTVDNASSNDVGMQYLKKGFSNWKENVLDGKFLHMRCFAHILSLIVKDGMKEVDDSIYRVRSAVRFVRSSTSRLQRYKACVYEEKLDSKKLVCLDVETR
ncbi:Putative AC transposase, partial [Linum perenne]